MLKRSYEIFAESARAFIDDDAPRFGAALAFYSLFSLAPVLVIVIGIAGLAFGAEAAQGQIFAELARLIGGDSAHILEDAVASARNPSEGVLAVLVAVGTLLVGATGVFNQLWDALDVIFKVPRRKDAGIFVAIRRRVLSFSLVLALGFLLLVSLVVSAALHAVASYIAPWLGAEAMLGEAINLAVSFLGIASMSGAILKWLPDRFVRWRAAIPGGLLVALLFELGKALIGFYLGRSTVASSYGAAGSIVVVILWMYYSAQIFLYGAEVTARLNGLTGKPTSASPSE